MTNLEKYNKIFIGMFHKTEEELPGLKYRGIPLWDSIGHMDLVGELEEAFDIGITPADIVPENFNSAQALYQMVKRLQEDG